MKIYKVLQKLASQARGEYEFIGAFGEYFYVRAKSLADPFIECEYPRELKERDEALLAKLKEQKRQEVIKSLKEKKLFAEIPNIGKVNASYESYLDVSILLDGFMGKSLFYRLYDNSGFEITKREQLEVIKQRIAFALLNNREKKWLLLDKIQKAKSIAELEELEIV